MLCSCFFPYSYSASRYSYSYSYSIRFDSIRSSIAIRPIGPQVHLNRLDPRAASPQFKQPIEYEYRFTEYDYEYDEI
jgi:hypothetical protein